MNRYFWLLMRFVNDGQTREERRAVYDRARAALQHQLAGIEEAAQRAYERLSFEEAVRSIEAGIARWGRHDASTGERS